MVGGHARRGVVERARLRWDEEGPAAECGHDVGGELVAGNGEVTARSQAAGTEERIGQGREGMDQGDPFVCSEHVEAERSGAMGHDRVGLRPDDRGDGGDRPVGNREEQHVHSGGRRADLVGASEDAPNLDADGCQRPCERQTSASGPDDANRCHCELSSFRPCHQVPFVSQFPPSLPTMCRSRDAGSLSASLARQRAGTRPASRSSSGASTKPRSAIRGWGTTRSGSQTFRSPTKRTSTSSVRGPLRTVRTRPASRFEPLRHFEQLAGSQAGLEPDDAVEVPLLAHRTAEGRCLVDGGDAQLHVDVAQLLDCRLQVAHAVAHVRAEAQVGLHGHRRRRARVADGRRLTPCRPPREA